MISNFSECFVSEQEFYLDKISYSRIEKKETTQEYLLNCIDNLEASVNEDKVTLIVRRTVRFEPQEIFELAITFGVVLKIKEEKMNEYDWNSIPLAEEFQTNGNFVLDNIMSRISLLVAEITSSFGQNPIIVPPMIAQKNRNI